MRLSAQPERRAGGPESKARGSGNHHAASTPALRAYAQPERSSLRLRTAGFTLIELVIAIAVASALFAAVVMGVNAVTGARAREATGELSAAIRMMYDEAALTGRTCRIAFQLPEARDDEGAPVSWRAQCAERGVTASKARDEELEAANDALEEAAREAERGGSASDRAALALAQREARSFGLPTQVVSLDELFGDTRAQVAQATAFSDFTSPLIEPRELPPSVRVGVWTQHQREVAEEGVAYLYFYPQGYTERAMVFVSQGEDNEWTIKISPLTGKTEIIPERLEVPQ